MNTLRPLATLLYGFAVMASGLYRYFTEADGEKGLWFGLVMGSLAVVGAALLAMQRTRGMGYVIAWLAVAFVGGWFAYELSGKLDSLAANARLMIILALTVVEAIILLLPARMASGQNGRAM